MNGLNNTTAQIIGRRLAALRDENGFTQEDIQKLTGINRTTYSKNESGKAAPSLTNLRLFAKIYGVSLDYLCNIESRRVNVLYDYGNRVTKEEKMLISYFRLLSDSKKKEILNVIEKEAEDSRADETDE